MASNYSFYRAVPGIVFALLVSIALARTVTNTIARKNAAEEQARLAAEQAAEQVRRNEEARVADRPRVERGVSGRWSGSFGSQSRARLTIKKDGATFDGVLHSGDIRETFRGELLADNKLVLSPIRVTRGGRTATNYSPDTVWLELSADGTSLIGSYRDANNRTGSVYLTRSRSVWNQLELRAD